MCSVHFRMVSLSRTCLLTNICLLIAFDQSDVDRWRGRFLDGGGGMLLET